MSTTVPNNDDRPEGVEGSFPSEHPGTATYVVCGRVALEMLQAVRNTGVEQAVADDDEFEVVLVPYPDLIAPTYLATFRAWRGHEKDRPQRLGRDNITDRRDWARHQRDGEIVARFELIRHLAPGLAARADREAELRQMLATEPLENLADRLLTHIYRVGEDDD